MTIPRSVPGALLALAIALVGPASAGSPDAVPAPSAAGIGLTPMDMADVNRLDRTAFVAAFGGVFEHSPWVAERAFDVRPFASREALHAAMVAVARRATRAEILALLNAHPELAGPEARARAMTAASASEQGSAGLDRMSAAEFDRFDQLNAAYRARFGFPFIIAVRGRDRATIRAEFERRLAQPVEAEVDAALTEIAAITRMRLDRRVVAAP